jgi:putative oxidoreductase
VLRLAVASFALHSSLAQMGAGASNLQMAVGVITAGAGLLLLVGLWTPLAAAPVAILCGWRLISQTGSSWEAFLGGSIALGLALLGPGAYSVDARSYGRRRISIDDSKRA